MKTYLQAYFDKLKLLVLKKAKITQLVPADCYRLALEIKVTTNKSVSETTIKRVFGFASSVHQPSIYTLNALSEYCGFESWNNFYVSLEQNKLQNAQQRSWGEISLNATKISLFNVQSNKYKCGIPYHHSIDREYVDRFAQHFLDSGATTGILHGAVGCGKTLGISRWVERQISRIHSDASNDIFLFTNGLSLLQGTAFGYHGNRWLAHLLGFETTELLDTFMEDHRTTAPGNFYLIVDDLHSDLVADRQFHTVLGQFIDMVNHFAQFSWFRIILTLRTASLLKFEDLFRTTVINPLWFSMQQGQEYSAESGMPYFSHAELHRLSKNINSSFQPYPQHNTRNTQLIHTPLFFQYYYELAGDRLNPYMVTPFEEYLIITQYLKKKVFNGVNNMAKQSFLEELTPAIEECDGKLQINRKQAYPIIRQHRVAYSDLLHSGLLHETTNGPELRQQTVLRFQSDTIANYFIALRLSNMDTDTDGLIKEIAGSPYSDRIKAEQLKWMLLFQIKQGNFELINQLQNIPFIGTDAFDAITFVCDGLHRMDSERKAIKEKINTGLQEGPFLDFAIRHISFHTDFEPYIEKLLQFELTGRHEVLLRSKLATMAMLKWDEETLLRELDRLTAMPAEAYSSFVISPLSLLSFLYQRFKGGIIDPKTARELQTLPYRLPLATSSEVPFHIDVLLYLYIKISGNADVVRPYLELLSKKKNDTRPENRLETDVERLINAFYLWEAGETEKALSAVEPLSLHAHQNTIYHLLYAIFRLQTAGPMSNSTLVEISQRAINLCEAHGFKFVEVYCRILLLEQVPQDERQQHINNLKFQFAAYGYMDGLGTLTQRYG